jgi:hypothetical protein
VNAIGFRCCPHADSARKAAPPVSLAGNCRFSAYGISDSSIDNWGWGRSPPPGHEPSGPAMSSFAPPTRAWNAVERSPGPVIGSGICPWQIFWRSPEGLDRSPSRHRIPLPAAPGDLAFAGHREPSNKPGSIEETECACIQVWTRTRTMHLLPSNKQPRQSASQQLHPKHTVFPFRSRPASTGPQAAQKLKLVELSALLGAWQPPQSGSPAAAIVRFGP